MHRIAAPVVLMYHSISEPRGQADIFNLQVGPGRFCEQIKALADTYEILSLVELGRDLREGRLRPNSIVITFDDGYANNLLVAAPILREFQAPATLFVCTGFLGRPTFWWDQLAETIFTATRLPERLAGMEPSLGDAETALCEATLDGDPATRRKLVVKIHQVLRLLDLDRVYAALAELDELFRPAGRLDDLRPMQPDEVRLAATYFAIGAHSVTHPPLSTLDPKRITQEIEISKRCCEVLAAKPVKSMAFPFGDYNTSVVQEVSQHMRLACTSCEAPIRSNTNPLEIPRIAVHDWSAEQLADRIRDVVRGRGRIAPLRLAARVVRQPRKAVARLLDIAWTARNRPP